jgi:hypothetical protein
MAEFFSSHTFTPRVAPRRAPVFAAQRTNELRTVHLVATAARWAAAAGEIVFFLWTLLALAFSFLVIAGFFE